MVKLANIIRNQDIFGHQVKLNFNNKGNSYQTLPGGCISIAVKIFMIVFITELISRINNPDNADNTLVTIPSNEDSM